MFRAMQQTLGVFQPLLTNLGILLLRLAFGGMMAFGHGWDKVVNFAQYSEQFPDPIGLGKSFSLIGAIAGELVAGICIVLGFCTRPFALLAAFTMVVAAFVVHAQDAFKTKELALVPGRFCEFDPVGRRQVFGRWIHLAQAEHLIFLTSGTKASRPGWIEPTGPFHERQSD